MTNIYSKLSITHNTLAGGTDSDSVLWFFHALPWMAVA